MIEDRGIASASRDADFELVDKLFPLGHMSEGPSGALRPQTGVEAKRGMFIV